MIQSSDARRYWFHLRRARSGLNSSRRFTIAPKNARGWIAVLTYLVAATSLPVFICLHGPFGWVLTGGETALLLGFACVVLATCDPREPSHHDR